MHAFLVATTLLVSLVATPASASSPSTLQRRTPFPFSSSAMVVSRSSITLSKRHDNGTVNPHERALVPASRSDKKSAAATRKMAHRHRAGSDEHRRATVDIQVLLGQATSMLEGMQGCQKDFESSLKALKTNGPSLATKRKFQNKVHAELARYRKSSSNLPVITAQLQQAKSSLDPAAADYGRQNLERCNKVEVILANASQSIQDTLADIDLMVYSAPILGNTLGAPVYDIKCLVDSALDVVTNKGDSLLNGSPLLSSLSVNLGTTVCKLIPQTEGC